jgi:hypothetical protein
MQESLPYIKMKNLEVLFIKDIFLKHLGFTCVQIFMRN